MLIFLHVHNIYKLDNRINYQEEQYKKIEQKQKNDNLRLELNSGYFILSYNRIKNLKILREIDDDNGIEDKLSQDDNKDSNVELVSRSSQTDAFSFN